MSVARLSIPIAITIAARGTICKAHLVRCCSGSCQRRMGLTLLVCSTSQRCKIHRNIIHNLKFNQNANESSNQRFVLFSFRFLATLEHHKVETLNHKHKQQNCSDVAWQPEEGRMNLRVCLKSSENERSCANVNRSQHAARVCVCVCVCCANVCANQEFAKPVSARSSCRQSAASTSRGFAGFAQRT